MQAAVKKFGKLDLLVSRPKPGVVDSVAILKYVRELKLMFDEMKDEMTSDLEYNSLMLMVSIYLHQFNVVGTNRICNIHNSTWADWTYVIDAASL